MNIPEKIRVLHQTYQISEVDNLHDGADDLYGQVRYLEERILLNSGASGEAKNIRRGEKGSTDARDDSRY